jgi:hypothetical protein
MLNFNDITWSTDGEYATALLRHEGYRFALRAWATGRYECELYTTEGETLASYEGDDAEPTLEYAIESAEGAALILFNEVLAPRLAPPAPAVRWIAGPNGFFAEIGDALASVWYVGGGSWGYEITGADGVTAYSGVAGSRESAQKAAEGLVAEDPDGWLVEASSLVAAEVR